MSKLLSRLLPLFLVLFLLPSSASALRHPYFSKNKAAEQKLERLLKAARVQALEYQPAGLSVELENLEGQKKSLQGYRGKVLLLTRWATWCGACRSELPSKAMLQAQLKHPRFAVIGISSESKEKVLDYQKKAKHKYNLSYIDPGQVMEQFFPGGGIPVTVLVDAWGWVIGIRKGAGPWHTQPVQALLKFLISIAPPMSALQEKVPAPQVKFPETIQTRVGQIFQLPLSLTWNGEQDKYSRIGFRLPRLKHLQQKGVQIDGVQADKDGNQRRYVLRLVAKKAGTFDLKPLLMNYWLKDNDNHYQTRIGTLKLVVTGLPGAAVGTKTTRKKPMWALFGLLGVLLLIGVFVLLAKGQKKKTIDKPPTYEEEDKREELLARLYSDSLLRLRNYTEEADELAFVEEIFWIRTEVFEEDDASLEKLGEDIRYGGEELGEGKAAELFDDLIADSKERFPVQTDELRAIYEISTFK